MAYFLQKKKKVGKRKERTGKMLKAKEGEGETSDLESAFFYSILSNMTERKRKAEMYIWK